MAPWPAIDPASEIGFIGVGAMGGGMAACLVARHRRVVIFTRSPNSGASLIEAGASRAASLEELGRRCQLIFLCLPDAEAVDAVLFRQPGGLAEALAPGSCIVDTSSTCAASAREACRRLAGLACHFIDAPVSGGQQAAREGRLACMAGGDGAILDSCLGALGTFCESVTHVGPVGAGQIVKGCNQVAVAATLLGVAEAVALAAAQGLDPYVMREILMRGTAASTVLKRHAPRIIERQFTPGFRAELMRKDLRMALQSARQLDVNLSVTRLAEHLLDCLCSSGFGAWDWSAVALVAQGRDAAPFAERLRKDQQPGDAPGRETSG